MVRKRETVSKQPDELLESRLHLPQIREDPFDDLAMNLVISEAIATHTKW